MKKDLPNHEVEDVFMAIVLEEATPEEKIWTAYLLNLRPEPLTIVHISSRGYGKQEGEEVQTSTLRHHWEKIDAESFVSVESIEEVLFGLTNEYLLSYYHDGVLYDKKFIFLPESIVDTNLIRIPLLNKPGVLIGQPSKK